MNRTISLRLPLLPALAGGLLLAISGCAPTGLGVVAGLETDEVYLRRGEEFVTDAEYLAFAYEQAGVSDGEDYYDPDRAAMSDRSGREFTPFANSMIGWGSPYDRFGPNNFGTFGNGWNAPYGGYGYSPYGFNPYGNSAFGFNPYGNTFGYNPYGTYGYNPYSTYGYNPYGYNPYGPAWGNGAGGWYGNNGWTDNTGINVSSGPRVPLLSSSGNNSNQGPNGLLVQPRQQAAEPLVTPQIMEQALGRHTEIEVATPPAPATERRSVSPWERMLSSPSIPDEVREPYTAPATTPRTEPSPSSPSRSVTPSRPSRSTTPPATRPSAPSRPSTSPSRPSGGGSRGSSSPSRSGRGG